MDYRLFFKQVHYKVETGVPLLGSRVIQWGWNPVGGSRANDAGLTPNDLVAIGNVGTVVVTTT
jgi:hypothetical protein